MIKILYTGAVKFGQSQTISSDSLGGLISSSVIPNNKVSNLFPAVSFNERSDDLETYRAIAIKNESNDDKLNFSIHVVSLEDSICDYKISAVAFGEDFQMEKIVDDNSLPYYAPEFQSADDVDNPILLKSTFVKQTFIGLWIERKVKPYSEDFDAKNVEHYFKDLTKKEEIEIVFSWDD